MSRYFTMVALFIAAAAMLACFADAAVDRAADPAPGSLAQPPADVQQRLEAIEKQLGDLLKEVQAMRQATAEPNSVTWGVPLEHLHVDAAIKAAAPLLADIGGTITADKRTNAVTLQGPVAKLSSIKLFIRKLDIKLARAEADTDIFAVTQADAADVAQAIMALGVNDRDLRVVADAEARAVIVRGSAEMRALAGKLIAELNRPSGCGGGEVRVFALKHIAATVMADALATAFDKKDCQIVADPRTNTIVASALSRKKLDQVKQIIEVMDIERKP